MDPENDPLQLSPNDRDLMIRTIIGEAGSDPSAPGVAAVIANRMRQTGQSAGQIVLAPGQFEPWSTRSKELMSYSPTDPAYKAAAKVVDDAISGKTPDPTGGATKFYSPSAQKALGRQPPAWDDGTGQPIGKQLFFGGQQSDPLAGFEIAPGAKSAGAPADDPLAGFEIAPSKATKAASSAPAAAAPAASSAPDDPLAGFDIAASAPPLVKAAAPPPPTSAMSDPGGGVEFMNSFPVVGPALVKGGAAIDALTSPLSGYLGGAVPNIPGATFSDRYANRTAALEQARKAFVENHPTAATATDVAGGIVGAAPLMAAAPAAFGLGEGPLAARMAIGALSNSALTGADTAVRGGSASDVLRSGELGLAGGAAGPLIGAGLGKIVSGVGSALSGVKPGVANIAETMREIGLTPIQARAALADLGPFGTLADVDPALTTKAGALASLGGQPTSILKRAMLDRAAGADQRVNDVVTGSLGQRPDLTAAQAAIKQDASTAAKPFYDAARANPQPMDVTPILADIDAKLPNASGSVQSALQTAKSYLTREISTVPG
ncbi:MAG: cell wall hydrolase, partial [Beijerinckiaceae bacterium]|nr:cell wall hydrolase [Beijerinckiaceae bacterium]